MPQLISKNMRYSELNGKSNTGRFWRFFTIALIISGFLILLTPKCIWMNPAVQLIAWKNRLVGYSEHKAAFIDSSGYLRSVLSPDLRWCTVNPFLKLYNQSVVLDLELQWVAWQRSQLLTAYQILKNYALQIGDLGGAIVHLAYPPSLPLPCPYKNNLTRIGGIHDGNKIICGIEIFTPLTKCIVYSLGSFGDFNFEWALLKNTSCEVHTYDCTSPPPEGKTERMTYHQICLGDTSKLQKFMYPYNTQKDNIIFKNESIFKRFDTILAENKHDEVHILKMDIEGGEYSVFSDLLCQTNKTSLPYQISFESHWWNRDIYHAILHQKMFAQFWAAGYRILQHEYNPGDHTCVEWTLMRVFC
ncbi:unnamed protein product [Rotaria magnacalcarata]|uniref:Methyltransferase domain-containing protein n=3 Tax=Rotaria magnacalcarata TaxID=392030 RepID=A0A816BGD3_9BILA|nr:unnamed protein product [Rotaria magnacalcarata]CAF4126203.1 unnamed protein product [Rotaria magnacalcarata]